MQVGLLRNPEVAAGPVVLEGPDLGKKYGKIVKKIKKSVKEGALCHGDVEYKYVKQQIKKHPYLLFCYDEDGDLVGFALLAVHDAHTLQVILLCTLPGVSGAGRKLSDTIDSMAAAAGVNKLFLGSVPNAMGFYEHMGYKLDLETPLGEGEVVDENNENGGISTVPMSKKLEAGGAGGAGSKGGSRVANKHGGGCSRRRRRSQMRSKRTRRASQK